MCARANYGLDPKMQQFGQVGRFQLGEGKVSLGLKVGATFFQGNYSDINVSPDGLDVDPILKDESDVFPNFGVGAYYYSDKYYLGFSVPNILKSKHLDFNGREFGSEYSHYFFTGGYVFDVNETIKFKPFFMLKSAFSAPTSLDLSTNFLFNEKFEIGATYRLDDSFGAMVNYAITPDIKIGYAYDHIVSDLKVATPSSHEIILLFDLKFSKKVSSSPRYF